MMGWSPQCYIPSFMEIRPPVPEKKSFEGFLPYIGVAAILVMWPGYRKQTFVPLPKEAPHKIWLWLAKQFLRRRCLSIVDGRTDGQMPDHWYTIYQRTNGPVKRSPDIWAKHKIKFGSKWPNHFWEKPVLIFKCKWPWAKVKKWPWTSILSYLHYLNWFQVTGCKNSEKSTVFTFSYR